MTVLHILLVQMSGLEVSALLNASFWLFLGNVNLLSSGDCSFVGDFADHISVISGSNCWCSTIMYLHHKERKLLKRFYF